MNGDDEVRRGGSAAELSEPRRLLEDPRVEDGADPSAAWAVGLLRAAEPYQTPAGRKQRVQLRLGHVARRRAPLVLRLAVAGIFLFGCATIVRAGLGHLPGWMARALDRVVGKSVPAAPAPAPARARRSAPPVEVEQPAVEPALPAPPPVVEPSAQHPAPRSQRSSSPRAVALAAPSAAEDAVPVSAAMRALRVERNPVRARALLTRYLSEHPNGNLAEEALAMSIEAALAHQDADVAALAARYLRLYPQGSFQALARQALAAKAPSAP